MADNLTPIKVKGSGTAGTAATDIITVQGIAAMTPLIVTQATAANLQAQIQGPVASGSSNTANPDKIGAVFNTTQPTVTNGQVVDLQATARGALIVATGVDAFTVTLTASSVTANQGTPNTTANAWPIKVTDGTNTAAVIATINSLKVDISSVSGAVTAASNPLFVELTDGTNAISESNPLPVFIETSKGTVVDSGQLTSSALAAGANVTTAAADITTGKTGSVLQATAASAVPLKIEFQRFDGTTATTIRSFFTEAMGSWAWNPADDVVLSQAGGTGKHFQIKFTNMDNINSSDVYGGITWNEV